MDSATIIGTALRLVGEDRAALERAVGTLRTPGIEWQAVPARLDDVFIHLLSQ